MSDAATKQRLDERTITNVRLRKQLDMIAPEYPVTVWLPGHGMVEIVAAVTSTIYVGGKPRPAVGLVTAHEAGVQG